MKNVVELRDVLADTIEGLKTGSVEYKQASEIANLAGKMINSAKAQLDYHALRKDTPKIKFLHVEEPVAGE